MFPPSGSDSDVVLALLKESPFESPARRCSSFIVGPTSAKRVARSASGPLHSEGAS